MPPYSAMGTERIAPCISTAKAGTVKLTEMSDSPERALMKVEIIMLPTSTRVDWRSSSRSAYSLMGSPSMLSSTMLINSSCCTASRMPLIWPLIPTSTPAVTSSGPPIQSMASL